MSSPPTGDRLEELLQRWDERRRQGEDVSAQLLCAGRPELAAELARRIQAVRALDPVLEPTTTAPLSTPPPNGADHEAGGSDPPSRYRPLRLHARGGLGEVYLVRDEQLGREVALKEIQARYAHDPHCRARFVIEAEVTGGLEHPGIVPVYSLGHHPDGRPYYAMRFIKGDSLKEAIEQFHGGTAADRSPSTQALAFRKLLGRFVDVCNAIAYAHSRRVLHRDLKPGNVMLGKYGETLVVDWGLAKPLGQPDPDAAAGEGPLRPLSSDGTAEATRPGSALGTPAYMSPEQAAGRLDRLGPASDVYSLGATLYCLLTGKAPFDGDDLNALLEGVRNGAFAPPRSARPDVPRALEAVCLKAMALAPEDRYDSARGLADEVERWLADEPVTAYREPWPTRLARWGRRYRTAVAAAAILVVTVTVGLAVGAVLLGAAHARTQEQRDLARTRLARALAAESRTKEAAAQTEAINRFLVNDMLAVPRPENMGRKITVVEALDRAAGRVDSAFPGQPEVEAAVRDTIGLTYRCLGEYEKAEPQLAKAHRLRAGALGDGHSETLSSLNNLGVVVELRGRVAEAEGYFRKVLEGRRRTLGADHPDTLGALNNLAESLGDQGKQVEAEVFLREALEGQRRVLGADHPNTLNSLHNLGTSLRLQGKPAEAETPYREAVAGYTRTIGPDHPDTLGPVHNLGALLRERGQLKEAEGLLRRAVEGRRRALGDRHPLTLASINTWGVTLYSLGRWDEARPLQTEALAGLRATLGDGHPHTLATMSSLALTLQYLGRFGEAEPLMREALEINRRAGGPRHPNTLSSLHSLAGLLRAADKRSEAEPLLREALGGSREATPADPRLRARCLVALGALLTETGRAAEAETLLREAASLDLRGWPLGHLHRPSTQAVLGRCLTALRRYGEAETLLLEGYRGLAGGAGAPRARVQETLADLVTLYRSWGRPQEVAQWEVRLMDARFPESPFGP